MDGINQFDNPWFGDGMGIRSSSHPVIHDENDSWRSHQHRLFWGTVIQRLFSHALALNPYKKFMINQVVDLTKQYHSIIYYSYIVHLNRVVLIP